MKEAQTNSNETSALLQGPKSNNVDIVKDKASREWLDTLSLAVLAWLTAAWWTGSHVYLPSSSPWNLSLLSFPALHTSTPCSRRTLSYSNMATRMAEILASLQVISLPTHINNRLASSQRDSSCLYVSSCPVHTLHSVMNSSDKTSDKSWRCWSAAQVLLV